MDEGQPPGSWDGVGDDFGFLHAPPDGPVVGFQVRGFSRFDPEAPGVAGIWDAPRFDVPVLGLRDVSAGQIALAARAFFGRRSSLNRRLFEAAAGAEGPEAAGLWLACLQSGDPMAHFGLGYTLLDMGQHRAAYRHLRHYTEIAPDLAWAWCYLGRAAAALGDAAEARLSFRRAIELEEAGSEQTDARELLQALPGAPQD